MCLRTLTLSFLSFQKGVVAVFGSDIGLEAERLCLSALLLAFLMFLAFYFFYL
jgi:hypothetical protein